ncbi:MAG: NUDIX hydrolase [Desulfobacterales bacterium]|nr:NUDIX hydrolase [Desulfobacterales bacterium]
MNFCSHCAAPVAHIVPPDDDRPRFVCTACGQIHYANPRLVVGCIPVWEEKILLCLRDIEPRRGKWTLPAGYLENGETVMEGARRETLEETGAELDRLEPYLLFDIAHINQLYLMFRARLVSPDFHRTKESAQVRLFDAEKIPWHEIAFPAIEETLKFFLADRPDGVFPFQIHPILEKMKPA